MEDLLAGYAAQLRGLDVMEGVFAGSKAIKHVITGHVARMNDCAPLRRFISMGSDIAVLINHVPE